MKTRAEEGRRGARKGGRNVGEEREKRKDRLIVTNTDPGLPNYKLTSWANFLPFSPISPPLADRTPSASTQIPLFLSFYLSIKIKFEIIKLKNDKSSFDYHQFLFVKFSNLS